MSKLSAPRSSTWRPARVRHRPRGPDFIGIGAQRAGTSWLYACLYEHPAVCMPKKEVNFFSRDRNWRRGFEWYEGIFAECPRSALAGEFSTSYLTEPEAPRRIHDRYPDARLIVSLRHPVDRAYSSYLNDIVAGVVRPDTGFWKALREHPEYLDSGRYATHLRGFLELFPREQLLISIFDDARRDPLSTVQAVYRFLQIDASFRPSMIDRRVGRGRVPRAHWFERWLLGASAAARTRRSLRPLWWTAKRMGLGDRLRTLNTRGGRDNEPGLSPEERSSLADGFVGEIDALEDLLGRPIPEWRR